MNSLSVYYVSGSKFMLPFNKRHVLFYFKGEHTVPPPNMPLWQKDYFELKAIKPSRLRKTFYLSLNCLK